MIKARLLFVVAAVAAIAACGGSGNDTGSSASSTGRSGSATPQTAEAHPTKGVGPIEDVDVASLDRALAPKGNEVFTAKCTACHKMEERYVGPALKGVTTRREPEWIMNMILNPDVMVKQDPTARDLLAKFIAPMTNQNLTEEEAKAVLVYFLEYDKNVPE